LNKYYITIIIVIHYVLFDKDIPLMAVPIKQEQSSDGSPPSTTAFQGPPIAKRE
jgi:hypothetical protein